MKKVELKNISKRYDNSHLAVSDITLSIEPGEFFVLVGPSGCGKSTMLRMIAGLETISSGELRIGEELANHLPPSQRELSMVFQNYALYPHLTVEENIVFGLHTKGLKKSERKERCEHVAKLLGLETYLKRKPRQLSGGQRQRVALARAIASQSPICLMDEPLSNLDAKLRSQMRSEIKHLQRELGLTLIYVTHDQVEAMTMADRMMILKEGEIQQIGRPLDIYNQPANQFVAEFIGTPPMNIIEALYEQSTNEIIVGSHGRIKETPVELESDASILFGVRPEHIRLSTENGSSNLLKGTIYNIEILGNETIIDVDLGDIRWAVRQAGQQNHHLIGETIFLDIPSEHITLFHQEGRLMHAATGHGQDPIREKVIG